MRDFHALGVKFTHGEEQKGIKSCMRRCKIQPGIAYAFSSCVHGTTSSQRSWRISSSWILLSLTLALPDWVHAQFACVTNDGAIIITGYTGPAGAVTIPDTTNGLPVTGIGPWAFYSTKITSVFINDSVTNIADGAFFDCESLTNVTVGDSVSDIGDWAFAFDSSLASVCFRGNAPGLGGTDVFYGDLLTIFYLPNTTGWGAMFGEHPAVLWNPPLPYNYTTNNSTITITGYTGSDKVLTIPSTINFLPVIGLGRRAFFSCTNLASVTIPNSVTKYSPATFENCVNLLGAFFQGNAAPDYVGAPPVFYKDNNATIYRLQGTLGWKSTLGGLPVVLWDPQGVSQLIYANLSGQIVVSGYHGPGGVVVIPSTIDGLPLTRIESKAFLNCTNLSGVIFPNTLTNLGDLAFAGCTSLTNVQIPNAITGVGVFYGCTALTDVIVPNSVTSIGYLEFADCTALTSITIPNSVTQIWDWAFQDCSSLASVYFQGPPPAANLTIFEGDNYLTNYYLPKIPGWGTTFAGRPTAPVLFTYTTNNGAITITRYIGIEGTVTIPDTINGLPVTTFANGAFQQCPTITNISMPKTVINIDGTTPLAGCYNLQTINVDALNPVFSSVNGVMFTKDQTMVVRYPEGRIGEYAIPNNVTTVGFFAFEYSHLTSIIVPKSVTFIGPAFGFCPNLSRNNAVG